MFIVKAFLLQWLFLLLLFWVSTGVHAKNNWVNILVAWGVPAVLPFVLLALEKRRAPLQQHPTWLSLATSSVGGTIAAIFLATLVMCLVRRDCF